MGESSASGRFYQFQFPPKMTGAAAQGLVTSSNVVEPKSYFALRLEVVGVIALRPSRLIG